MEGVEETHLTTKPILRENINLIWSQEYESNGYNNPVPNNILKPDTQIDTPT